MDYIGSKKRFIKWIFDNIQKSLAVDSLQGLRFLDGCSGSGVVAVQAAEHGMHVWANDLFSFSSIMVEGSVKVKLPLKKASYYISELNKVTPIEGFFYKNYSEHAGRLYFSDANAGKIDACRSYVEQLQVAPPIKSYLLRCLLEAVSAVSNTTGVQAAFLKQLKARAQAPLVINQLPFRYCPAVETSQQSVEQLLLTTKELDVIYIDPPYNGRQYGPNYHLYETLIKNDDPFLTTQKTGLRDWEPYKSDFCNLNKAIVLIRQILRRADSRLLIFSYNSDGLLTPEHWETAITEELPGAEFTCCAQEVKRYKADNKRKNKETNLSEYLLIVKPVKTTPETITITGQWDFMRTK